MSGAMEQRRIEGAFQGALLGTAVGDALGLPFEGMSKRRVRKMLGSRALTHRFVLGRGMVLRAKDSGPPFHDVTMAIQDGCDDRGPLDPAKLFKRRGIGGGLGAVIRFTDSFRCETAEDGSGKTVYVIRYSNRPKRRSPGAGT